MTTQEKMAVEVLKGGRWFALLALLVLALFGVRTISHSDFWMTLATGRWIAAHGVPHTDPFSLVHANAAWTDPMWLYDLLVYHLWSAGGAVLVTVAHVAAVVAGFLLLMRAARPFGGWLAITCALLVTAWLLAPAFMARARVFTLLFPALFIFCMVRGGGRWWPWLLLLPAQVLWTNMYHTFRLGPVICLAFAVQEFLPWWRARNTPTAEGATPPDKRVWLNLVLLTVAVFAMTFVNPYGWHLYREVSGVGFGASALLLSEQVSVFSAFVGGSDTNGLIWAAAIVNLMGLVAEKQRLPLGITLLALLGTSLAIMSPHYATFMAVCSFPFSVLSLRATGLFLWDSFTDVVQRQRQLFGRLLLGALLLTMGITTGRVVSNHYYYSLGSASAFGCGVNEEALPAAASAVLAQDRFPIALLNNVLDGGNLLWHLPQRRVFLDARAQFQGQALLQLAARGFAGDAQAWQTIESKLRPAAILINCCHPQATLGLRQMLSSGHWRLVYFDGTSVLLVLNVAENRALLQDPQLQALGLTNLEIARRAYERRIAAHWFPTHSPALIGAGHTLLALKQYAEAEKVFLMLTRGAPQMAGAWLDLGICRGQLGRWQEALTAFRRATGAAPKNPLAWLWFSRACQQLGYEAESRDARQNAFKLNPNLVASFDAEWQTTNAAPKKATPGKQP